MKHLYNRKSGRNLCTVKNPTVNDNTSDRGQILGGVESTCRVCAKYWPEYYRFKADIVITDHFRFAA